MHVPFPSYGKTLPGSRAPKPLIISNDKHLLWKTDRHQHPWQQHDNTWITSQKPASQRQVHLWAKRQSGAATSYGSNGSCHSKSPDLFLFPAHNTQVHASLNKKITGLDFNVDVYEDSYNTFIWFLKGIQTGNLLAYHRLMSDLYKLVLCMIMLISWKCANSLIRTQVTFSHSMAQDVMDV